MIKSTLPSKPAPGYRFPREVIAVAVGRYLRVGLSHRDVQELLVERGIEVDHLNVYRSAYTIDNTPNDHADRSEQTRVEVIETSRAIHVCRGAVGIFQRRRDCLRGHA